MTAKSKHLLLILVMMLQCHYISVAEATIDHNIAIPSSVEDVLSEELLTGTVTRRQYKEGTGNGASATFDNTPLQGSLLVVIAGHRKDIGDNTISGSGWTQHIMYNAYSGLSNNRRGLAVWTKIAGASEPSTITTDFGSESSKVIIQEFSITGATFTTINQTATNQGSTTGTTSQSTGTTPTTTSANTLVISALVGRYSAGSTPIFGSGLQYTIGSNDAGSTYPSLFSAFAHKTTTGAQSSTATWSSSIQTSSGIIAYGISPPTTNGGAGTDCSGRVTSGLIALYDFSEGSGNVVNDISGYGSPLDLIIENTSNTNWLAGDCGLSINTSTVIKSNSAASKIHTACTATNELTIEVWAKSSTTSSGGPARLVAMGSAAASNARNFCFGPDYSTEYESRIRTTSNVSGYGPPLNGGTPSTSLRHYVVTRSSAGVEKLYIDGSQVSTQTVAGDFSNWDATFPFAIGNRHTNLDRKWLGEVYKVAIYNKDLSASEVSTNYSESACCQIVVGSCEIANWGFNEGSGSTVTDSEGNIPNAAISGATWTTRPNGGTALSFDGSNDYINLSNDSDLQTSGDITIMMWLKPDDFASRRNPWAKAYGGEGTITQETNGVLNFYWGSAGSNGSPYTGFGSSSALSANQWTHVAVTRELNGATNTLKWYFNGSQVASTTSSQMASSSALSALIGDGYAGNYKGDIDDVKLFQCAMTASEISTEMNTTSNGGCDIIVRAKGDCGGEDIELKVGGTTVATFNLTTSYANYTYSGYDGTQDVSIYFADTGCSPDPNVYIDYIIVDGSTYQTETVGTHSYPGCANSGFSLWCEGTVDFGTLPCSGGNNGGGQTCDDGVTLDIYAAGTSSSNNITVNVPTTNNVNETTIEVAYKNCYPGSTVTVSSSVGNIVLNEEAFNGNGYSCYVYRKTITGGVTNIFEAGACGTGTSNSGLQSMTVYVERDVDSGVGYSSTFTTIGGYNNLETFSLPIPTSTSTRDVTLKIPISEVTSDNRFLTVNASSNTGSASASVTITGPDLSLGSCCFAMPELTIYNVPANSTAINFEIDTRGSSNPGPPAASGNGQSYAISGTIYTSYECPCEDLTSGGTIGSNESMCGSYDPANITNITLPSGGLGSYIEYQWQQRNQPCGGSYGSWTTISGATSSTYNPGTIGLTTQYRRRAKRDACGPYVYSNTVTKEVIQQYTSAGVIAGDQSLCGGYDPSTITSSSIGSGGCGGTAYYIWQKRDQPCGGSYGSWSTISGANSATYNPPAITITTQYRRLERRSSGCSPGWQYSNLVTKEVVQQTTDGGAITGDELMCGGYDPGVIGSTTPATGGCGGTVAYYWGVRTIYCDGTKSAYTNFWDGETHDPGPITETKEYIRRARRISGCSPSWSYSNTVIKEVVEQYTSAGSIAGDESMCGSYNPAIITSVSDPVGGCRGTEVHVWQQAEFNCATNSYNAYTNVLGASNTTYDPPTLTVTTKYRRVSYRNSTCSPPWVITNEVVKEVVDQYTSAGTIAGDESKCSSYNPALITSTSGPIGGCGGTQYNLWQKREFDCNTGSYGSYSTISGANGLTYDPPSVITVTTQYRRLSRRAIGCSPGWEYAAPVTKEVVENTASGGTIVGNETFCAASYDPTTITSTVDPSGGCGGTEEYRWYKWERNCATGSWGSGIIISGAQSLTYDPPVITVATRYRRYARRASDCTGTNSSWVVSNFVYKYLHEDLADGGTISTDQEACGNFTPALLTGTVPSGGCTVQPITYKWQYRLGYGGSWTDIANSDTQNYQPVTSTVSGQYRRVVLTGACSDLFSNIVTLTVNRPPSATLDDASFCPSESVTLEPQVCESFPDIIAQREFETSGWYNQFNSGGSGLTGDGSLCFDLTDASGQASYQMIGLTTDPFASTHHSTIDYAMYVIPATNNYRINIYENGSNKGNHYTSTTSYIGSTFCLRRTGTTIEYLLDGTVVYTSLTASNGTLYFDNAFHSTSAGQYAKFENIQICGDASDVDMTYSWSGGGSGATKTVSSTGTYTVTVTDDNGCSTTASATVTQDTPPNATLNKNRDLSCTYKHAYLYTTVNYPAYPWILTEGMAYQSSGASCGSKYINIIGQAPYSIFSQTVSPITPNSVYNFDLKYKKSGAGAVIARLVWYQSDWTYISTSQSNLAVNSSWTNLTVSGTAPANANKVSVQIIAYDNSIADIDCFSLTTGAGPELLEDADFEETSPFQWSGPSGSMAGQRAIYVVNPGTYNVTVTDPTTGCTATSSIVVNQDITPPNASASNDGPLTCANTSVTLTASSTTAGATYAWSNSLGTNATATVSNPGTYTVTVTDPSNGCTATASTTVAENTTPTNVYCQQYRILPHGGSWGPWTAFGANCEIELCELDGLTDIQVDGGPNINTGWVWKDEDNNIDSEVDEQVVFNNIDASDAGTYTATLTNSNGCVSSFTFVVIVEATATVTISGNQQVCVGETATITSSTTGGLGTATYQWQISANNTTWSDINGATSSTYTTPPMNAKTYYRIVVSWDGLGCSDVTSSSSEIDVDIESIALTADAFPIEICPGGSTTLTVNDTIDNGGLLDYSSWTIGTGTTSGFNANGPANENHRITDTDPWGNSTVVWEARPDGSGGADGGWYTTAKPIDHTKTYRVSVWVNRKVAGIDGRFYLGMYGYSGATNEIKTVINGAISSNPYFYYSDAPPTATTLPEDEWVLVVGHIRPSSHTGTSLHTESGLYSTSEGKTGNIQHDYQWLSTSTTAIHRSYLFYSPDATARQQWVYPRFDLIDGTEPSIDELLGGFDVNGGLGEGASWEWYTGSCGGTSAGTGKSITVSPSATTTYYVRGEGGDCSDSDCATVTVTVNTPPSASASNDGNITCADANSTLTALPAGMTYAWSGGGTSQTKTVTTPGTYTVTVTDANGCTDTAQSTVGESTTPTNIFCERYRIYDNTLDVWGAWTNFSGNCTIEMCENAGTDHIQFDGGPNINTGWVWKDEDGNTDSEVDEIVQFNNISLDDAGTYTGKLTNSNGCISNISFNVIVNPNPTAGATSNGPLTCALTTVTMTATPAGMTYSWSSGGSNQSENTALPGTYTVTVTDSNGCSDIASVTVTQDITPPIASASNDGPITCANTSVVLTALPAGLTYAWSGGGTNQTKTVMSGGTYTVTVTDTNGCTDTAETTVIENTTPTNVYCQQYRILPHGGSWGPWTPFGANCEIEICELDGLTDIQVDGGPNINTGWVWKDEDNNIDSEVDEQVVFTNIDASDAGTYTATLTNSNGCVSSFTFDVIVEATATATLSGNQQVCVGETATLTSFTTGGLGTVTYQWQISANNTTWSDINGATSSTYTTPPMNAKTYYRIVVSWDGLGCSDVTSSSSEIDVDIESIALTADAYPIEICLGGSTILTVNDTVDNGGLLDYSSWNVGTGSISGQFNAAGATAENHRITDNDPWGNSTVVWEAQPQVGTGSDGGWNSVQHDIDHTQSYRFSVWVNREIVGTSGRTYFGTNGYGSTNGLKRVIDGTTATNNYFYYTSSPPTNAELPENEWVLMVGHIYPSNHTGTNNHPESGRYTSSGGKIGDLISDFQWLPQTEKTLHRTFLYSCDDVSVRQKWVYPRLELLDGTEPSIDQLLGGFDVNGGLGEGASWEWYTGSCGGTSVGTGKSITVSPSATTTYYVRGEGGDCSDSDCATVTVTVNTPPSASASNDGNITCSDQNSTMTALPAGMTYTWSGGGTGQTKTVTAAGTYTVTVTDANGCTATAQTTVGENITPTNIYCQRYRIHDGTAWSSWTNFSGNCDIELCADDGLSDIQFDGGPDTNTGWVWKDEDGNEDSEVDEIVQFSNIGLDDAGTYTGVYTNQYGCISNISFNVIVNPNPTAGATSNGPLTCALTTVTMTATPAGMTYSWSGGGSAQTKTTVVAGTYTVTITDSNGCSDTASITVGDNFTNPNAGATNDGPLTCTNTSVTLTATSTTPGATFSWSGGGSNATKSVSTPGTYTVTVTDPSNGCTTTAQTIVTQDITDPNAGATNNGPLTCTKTSVTLTATSTTPGATFSWSGGGSNATKSVSTPGTYTVTVTDPSNGCTTTAQTIVTQDIADPNAGATNDGPLTCANTSVDLTATSTTPGATFSWSGGGSNATKSVSTPGTYTVTVTDPSNGCTTTAQTIVTQDITDPNAGATNDGPLTCTNTSATLTATSTTPGATFSWSGGGSNATKSVSTPGTYTVTVTDPSNGCTTTAQTIVTQDTTDPNAGATNDGPLTCTNTSVTLTATSSTPGATFSWSGGGSNATKSVSTPGTYTVTVTDPSNGCTTTAQTIVTQDITDPNAGATNDGPLTCTNTSVTLTATSTTPGATFSWSGGGSNATKSVSTPGTYTVTVTDPSNGCTTTAQTIVTQDITDPNAGATNDGPLTCTNTSATLTATSTTPGATFSWSGGGSNATKSVSTPGTYTVTVTDPSNGCTTTAQTIVTQDTTDPNAGATNDGPLTCTNTSVTLTATSSTPGATFSWSGGGSNATKSVSTPGTYTVTVTDPSNGCTTTAQTIVTQDITDPNAGATNDGPLTCANTSVTLTATSTTPGATFSWSGGGSNATKSVSTPGTYTVTVTDPSNGCTTTAQTIVTQDIADPNAGATNDGPLTCANTSVDLTATSTTPGATFSWSGGGSNATKSVSTPGTYTVTVTDPSNGCTTTAQTIVIQNNTPTPIYCQRYRFGYDGVWENWISFNGNCDIELCENDGLTDFQFDGGPDINTGWVWKDEDGITDSEVDEIVLFSNIGLDDAGIYTGVLTDANGCVSSLSFNVIVNANPIASASNDGPLTCAKTDVTLTALPAGMTFSWSGGGSNATKSVSTPGTYTVTVTDPSNGCTTTAQTIVTQDITDPNAGATNDGPLTCTNTSVTLTATSTTPGATFSWSGGGSNATKSDSTPGTYTVTVTDPSNGCTTTAQTIVTQDITDPNAGATNDGPLTCTNTSVTLTATSTTPGATFSWNGGGSNATKSVSTPGTYTVTVTDPSNGCTTTAQTIVTQDITDPNAGATNDGPLTCTNTSVTLTVTSTTPGATFSWSGGGSNATKSVSTPGTYTVTVTDPSNGCTTTAQTIVTQDIADPNASATNDGPLTCTNTSVTLTATSTTPGATFSWSGGGSNATKSVSTPGTYTVTVTDPSNGCTTTAQTIVTQDITDPNAGATNDGPLTCANTSVDLTATSTTPGATFSWSGGGSNATKSVSTPGTYTVTVTDPSNGCTTTAQTIVTQDIADPNAGATNDGPLTCANTSVTLTATSTTPGATFSWSGGGSNATKSVSTPGTYTVTITDPSNGCTTTAQTIVTQNIATPTATASADEIICSNANTTVSATANGGSGMGYIYTWDNGLGLGASHNVTVNANTTYTVTVTDSNGCTGTDDVTITIAQTPQVSISVQDPTICAGETATITSSASGGTGSVTYQWQRSAKGSTWSDISGATSSSYTTPALNSTDHYRLKVSYTGTGCEDILSAPGIVNVETPSTVTSAFANPVEICLGTSATLSVNETSLNGGEIDYSTWATGTGSTNGYGRVGDVNENNRINDIDPWGNSTVVWEAQPTAVSGPDGGWNTSQFDIDNTKLYRFSVWVNRKVLGSDGKFYLGTKGFGSTNGLKVITTGATSTNPYFFVSEHGGTNLLEDEWILVVGHVFPSGHVGTTLHPESGRYTTNAGYVGANTRDFAWLPETTKTLHRSFLYYSTDTSVRQQLVYPRVDIVDGNEPTISELLNGFDSNNGLGAGGTYEWFTGTCGGTLVGTGESITVNPTTTTTYYVRATGDCNTTDCESVTVTVNNLPATAATNDGPLTCADTDAILTATPSGLTYIWSTTETTENIIVNSTGTYTVTVTDTNGCSASSSTTVSENITPPVANAGTDQEICESTNVTLTATGGGTYQWSDGGGNMATAIVSPASTKTYTVTVTAANGCTDTDQVEVVVNKYPTNPGTVSGDESLCGPFNPSQISNTANAYGSSGYSIEYRWQKREMNCSSETYGSWTDISNETNDYYDPSSVITTTTQYRRLAGQDGCTTWISTNIITKEVVENQTDPGTIAADQAGCDSFDPAEITGGLASGGCGGTMDYQWQSRTIGGSWSDIPGATSINYDPSTITETTEYQRLVRSAPCPYVASNIVVMTINTATFTNVALGSNLDCDGNCTGTIDVVVDHSVTGDYMLTYTFEGNSTQVGPFTQNTATISNLCAGSYSNITVSSTTTLCTETWSGNVTISESHADWEHVTHTSDVSDCFANTCDGSFVIDANLGVTGAFNVSYRYDGNLVQLGPYNSAGDIHINNLCAGTYSDITITSIASGCTDVWPSDIIIETPDFDATVVSEIDDPCLTSEGSATLSILNGLSPYTIDWHNEDNSESGTVIFNQHGNVTIDGLSGGNTYCFKVTDSNGCVND